MTLNAEAFDSQRFRRAGGFGTPNARWRSAAGLSGYHYATKTQRYGMDNGLPLTTERLALAIHFDELLRTGQVENQAELARHGQVTRARLTQIMNLLNLAPQIQEQLLFHQAITSGWAPVSERQLCALTGG